jgi:hypothetical protein
MTKGSAMYVEQYMIDSEGQIRIGLVWMPDRQYDNKEKLSEDTFVIIDLLSDDTENIVNFDLN